MKFVQMILVSLAILAGQPAFSNDAVRDFEKTVKETRTHVEAIIRMREVAWAQWHLDQMRTQPLKTSLQNNYFCKMTTRMEKYGIKPEEIGTDLNEITKFRRDKFLYETVLLSQTVGSTKSLQQLDRMHEVFREMDGTCPK